LLHGVVGCKDNTFSGQYGSPRNRGTDWSRTKHVTVATRARQQFQARLPVTGAMRHIRFSHAVLCVCICVCVVCACADVGDRAVGISGPATPSGGSVVVAGLFGACTHTRTRSTPADTQRSIEHSQTRSSLRSARAAGCCHVMRLRVVWATAYHVNLQRLNGVVASSTCAA